ncbi:MAG TPA: cation:proton antiporter, partial [Miltoncostaeaceae bacterium]|nr:cation:proton antiporter [Miltoncostaeaceae bacterium]
MSTADTVAYVLLAIVLIVAAARILGSLMKYIGQPVVVGEIIAGVLLGPTLLGKELSGDIFPTETRPVLSAIATVALIFFMFLVGLDLDMSLLRGRVRAILVVSVAALAVPFAAGFAVGPLLHDEAYFLGEMPDAGPFTLLIGAALTVTAFPVMARILLERRLTRTSMGAVGLASAAIVTVGLFTLVGVAAGAAKGEGPSSTALKILYTAVFLAAMFGLVRPLLARLGQAYDRIGKLTPNMIATIFVLATLSGYVTDRIGITAVIGPFVLGLCMPRREGITRALTDRIESFAVLFLLPVFFGFSGLATDLRTLSTDLILGIVVFTAAGIAAKWIPVVLAGRAVGLTWREGNLLGVLMSCRGLLPLIVANVGVTAGLVEPGGPIFAILVIYALVTTILTNPLANLFLPKQAPAPADVPAAAASRILVGVGPNGSAARLAGAAKALAGDRRPLELLVAQPAALPDEASVRSPVQHDQAEVARTLSGLVPLSAIVGGADVTVTPLSFSSPDPADDLLRLIDESDPRMVVMGVSRRGIDADVAVARRVAAASPVPVVVLYDPRGDGLIADGRPVVAAGGEHVGPVAEALAAGLSTTVATDAPGGAAGIVVPMDSGWQDLLGAADAPLLVVAPPAPA